LADVIWYLDAFDNYRLWVEMSLTALHDGTTSAADRESGIDR